MAVSLYTGPRLVEGRGYAGLQADLLSNVRFLVLGMWLHHHSKEWLPCLGRVQRKYNALGLISLGTVAMWAGKGKRAQEGRSGVFSPSD